MKRYFKPLVFINAIAGLIVFFGCTDVIHERRITIEMIEDPIRRGDKAFEWRDYRFALEEYEQADRGLDSATRFENESQSKDMSLLQTYHNAKSFLNARIELTKLAIEIRTLRS